MFDVVALPVSAYLALSIPANAPVGVDTLTRAAPTIVVLLAIRIATHLWFGIYSHRWRHASTPELMRLAASVFVGTLGTLGAMIAIIVVLRGYPTFMPASFWLTELLLSLLVVGGSRFLIRITTDLPEGPGSVVGVHHPPTLLFGAGRTGVLMARSAQRNPGAGVNPVGFLDDDPSLAGSVVADLPVFGGLGDLSEAVQRTGARTLLVTMPSAPGNAVRRVANAAIVLGLTVRTVPSMTDLIDGTVDAHRVRRIKVEDLLRRQTISEHAPGVEEIIAGQTIMITGAGGSIGSELARQVFALGPGRLVLVDRAESGLYLTLRELESGRSRGLGSGELRTQLANVASSASIHRLLAAERPSLVFHAAAYKHVPMMEDHPSDAAYVNVGGTAAILDAAIEADVKRFVFVSTDKAVNPSNVMGASKRIAEMLVADASRRSGRPYVSVRFGNVLGSAGSVLPIFEQQLENGVPLTITDSEATRYFMTIPEATWLILDAAAIGEVGDVFALDMGEPIRIMDLARDLVRLWGKDPDAQPMEFVGLRPGEKLHEELFYAGEHVAPTATPRVLRASVTVPPAMVRADVRGLLDLATGEHDEELRTALLEYAMSTSPDDRSASVPA